MFTKFILTFGILALVVAVAGGGTPTQGTNHKVTLFQPAVVAGAALKAGEYKVNVKAATVTFTLDKETNTVAAKVETGTKKFDQDLVQYDKDGDHLKISQICLGGTKTRLIFN